MANANINLQLKGADKTAPAFRSIQYRARSTAAQLRLVLGGALAAAGAYLSLRSIHAGIEELGHLSDLAQKTSTNVAELSQASTALAVLGVNGNVDLLAKSFSLMEKNTGRSGLPGFYETIRELGKIPDASERAQGAMKTFGRSGLEFMPLINAAAESTVALEEVVAAMPAIPEAAAQAGDDAADAMKIAASGFKAVWLQGLSTVVNWFGQGYTGGIRTAAAQAANSLMYYTREAVAKVISYYRKLQAYLVPTFETIGSFIGAKIGGATWRQAWDMAGETYAKALDEMEDAFEEIDALEHARTERFRQEFEDRAIVLEKFAQNYKRAAMSTRDRALAFQAAAEDAAAKKPQVRNDLILAGSAQALRISLLGPQLQNETKKQTALLAEIAANTKDVADNTEAAQEGESYGVID